jgi:ion channel-forming bestrophin family protein
VIEYDRTRWFPTTFAFWGTVLPKILGPVGVLTGFCLLLCLFDQFVLEPTGHHLPDMDQLGHVVLGSALSLLIVFRTNTANQRYWESRSHWGMIVNSCRNLARMGATYAPPADELARLLTAYVIALKEYLRGTHNWTQLRSFLPGRVYEGVITAKNPPEMLARSLSEWVRQRLSDGKLDSIRAMEMERLVCVLLDQQGGCEKIKKTPLPFVYAALIKQLMFLYLYSLPFVLVHRMGFAAPLVVTVVALGMLGIEEAGVEIENPFNLDANNLPLEQLCDKIAQDVKDLTQ